MQELCSGVNFQRVDKENSKLISIEILDLFYLVFKFPNNYYLKNLLFGNAIKNLKTN